MQLISDCIFCDFLFLASYSFPVPVSVNYLFYCSWNRLAHSAVKIARPLDHAGIYWIA